MAMIGEQTIFEHYIGHESRVECGGRICWWIDVFVVGVAKKGNLSFQAT